MLLLAGNENGAATCTNSAIVGCGVRGVQLGVERTGVCATQIGKWNAGTADIIVFVPSFGGDEGVDVGQGPAAQVNQSQMSDQEDRQATHLLVSPRPRESSSQLAWTVLKDE